MSDPVDQGVGTPERIAEIRKRDLKQLRAVVSMLAHFIWHRQTRPGDHLWSIPADQERDWDCILTDGIDELEQLRAQVDASAARIAQLEAEQRVALNGWKAAADERDTETRRRQAAEAQVKALTAALKAMVQQFSMAERYARKLSVHRKAEPNAVMYNAEAITWGEARLKVEQALASPASAGSAETPKV